MRQLSRPSVLERALPALLMGLIALPIGARVLGTPPGDQAGLERETPGHDGAESTPTTDHSEIEHEIPPIIYSDSRTDYSGNLSYPVWVTADAAVTPSGELVEELFSKESRFQLGSMFKRIRPRQGCLRIEEFYTDYLSPPDRTSLEKAVRHSEAIATARVLGKDYGFNGSTPGQLIAAEVTESIRGPLQVGAVHYFVIPKGEFQAGSYNICKIDSRYAEPPQIGEEALLLVPDVENPDEPFLDLVWSTSLITFQENGNASLPHKFSLSRTATRQEVDATAREATKSQILSLVEQYADPEHGRDR